MINTTSQLFDEIDRHFLDSSRLRYPIIFTQSQRQVEGWFKGELLYLFSSLQEQSQLLSWESEALLPNNGRICILFVYPSPNPVRWRQTLEAYNTRISPTLIKEISNIEKYPSPLYIAKLEILSNKIE